MVLYKHPKKKRFQVNWLSGYGVAQTPRGPRFETYVEKNYFSKFFSTIYARVPRATPATSFFFELVIA